VETAENTVQEKPEVQENIQTNLDFSIDSKTVCIEPDLDFIQALSKHGGDSFEKCFQCGTCTATCNISPDTRPFPRKEMIWAAWGMKDRLLKDPDIWLCFQCNDCSIACPRSARPGDVLAAVRRESINHYAFPRFLARWVNQPKCIPLLLGIPAALLTLALLLKDPIENALGLTRHAGERIIYSYSSVLPHWLLNGFFLLLSVLILLVVVAGIMRFWKAMKISSAYDGIEVPARSLVPSIISTLKDIFTHKDFSQCTAAHSRFLSHACVFFGFIALFVVALWVITSGLNPLIRGDFVYPFSFWSPWKILANLGGIALISGCLLMIRDRLMDSEKAGASSFSDWTLITTLLVVAPSDLPHYCYGIRGVFRPKE
jgi:quinone-modifying oxidoreductase subunit QmoC